MTTKTINRFKAESLLARVVDAQTKFWNLLGDLEAELGGVELESTDDYVGLSLDDLLEKVDGEGELEA